MANLLGQRVLAMYAAGTADQAALDKALAKGWISQDEYDAAIAANPQEA